MASTREHEQDCSRPENADRPENCLDEDDELEGIREDLYKGMQGSWEEVVNMYKQNPRVSKVKFDNIIGNTALHFAVIGRKIDVVRNLVDAINEACQDPAEILFTPNKYGNTPLHLAAYIGSIEMCECIIAEITPIILAAKNGVLEMVVKILEAFPMTILDADSQENSIALVAVGNQQFHVYDFLIGYNHVVERDLVFNVVDSNGNTALHLAAMPHEYESWLMPASILLLQWKVKWYETVFQRVPGRIYREDPI